MIRRIFFAILGFLVSFVGTWELFLVIAMVSPTAGELSYDVVFCFMIAGGVLGTVLIFRQGAPQKVDGPSKE